MPHFISLPNAVSTLPASITLLKPIMPIKLAAPQTSSLHQSPDPLACMWFVEPCSPVKMSRDSIHKLDISLHWLPTPSKNFWRRKIFSPPRRRPQEKRESNECDMLLHPANYTITHLIHSADISATWQHC
jgi:hypothetical protein